MTYRISELAGISGVPATTLGYYEAAGLLPADRTASGYRVDDDASLERLAFISSAKPLGLSLENHADLLEVWERRQCMGVRTRLAPNMAPRP